MRLTEHFSSDEAGIGWASMPAELRPNALATLALLEALRSVVGVPLRVSSLYRSPAHNAAVNGEQGSQHLDATAADVVPLGLDYDEAWRRARESSWLRQKFGQLIGYDRRSHLHVSLPTRGKLGEVLWATAGAEGTTRYALLNAGAPSPDLFRFIPANARPLVAGLLVAGVLFLGD